jgi:nucleotide-binding universal stress UspA family protein
MSLHHLTSRILVPFDGSELATITIPYVRALATPETELVLFRAVPEPIPMMELAGASTWPGQRIASRNRELAEDYLGAVASVLEDACPTISTATRVGDAPEAILATVRERAATMVVLASHGRGFLGRVVIGSVADRVMRASAVPVLVVHPTSAYQPVPADSVARIDRLVVPLDGSAMAGQALPVAAELAHRLGTPVHLVRALPAREDVAGHPGMNDVATYDGLAGAAREALAAEASRLGAGGLAVTSSAIVGPPARAILDEVGAHDVVVMTSHGRGGVRRWLMGSVAERLIRDGTTPVLLVPVAERAMLAGGE